MEKKVWGIKYRWSGEFLIFDGDLNSTKENFQASSNGEKGMGY